VSGWVLPGSRRGSCEVSGCVYLWELSPPATCFKAMPHGSAPGAACVKTVAEHMIQDTRCGILVVQYPADGYLEVS